MWRLESRVATRAAGEGQRGAEELRDERSAVRPSAYVEGRIFCRESRSLRIAYGARALYVQCALQRVAGRRAERPCPSAWPSAYPGCGGVVVRSRCVIVHETYSTRRALTFAHRYGETISSLYIYRDKLATSTRADHIHIHARTHTHTHIHRCPPTRRSPSTRADHIHRGWVIAGSKVHS